MSIVELTISLDHYSIRTTELEPCRKFYRDCLGLREGPRPPFDFPGIWFYAGDVSVVHIVGVDPTNQAATSDYLGSRTGVLRGGGAIDHVAFAARGLAAMKARLQGLSFRERKVPSLGLIQLFLEDPNGVTIELNFAASEVPM